MELRNYIASEIQRELTYVRVKHTYNLTDNRSTRVDTTAKIIKLIAEVYSGKIPTEVKGCRIHVLTTS